jgi:hypothetical protein
MLERCTYRAEWSSEHHGYVGLCDQFPSLSWLTPTQPDVLPGIVSIVAEVVTDTPYCSGDSDLWDPEG